MKVKKEKDPDILVVGGTKIKRGQRVRVFLESAALYDYTKLKIPVEVIRGKLQGPVLFVSAAIHGDEINGVEIARRLLQKSILSNIKGTLIVIPIVNIFGFNNKSRYLPDRRDLNHSFPGSSKGSLARRLANILMKEIVSKSTHGIDFHTGAIHRTNLPQIRAFLEDEPTKYLAEGFGVPVVINSKLRDGSLREAARKKNVSMLLFEGGQALRFEEDVIKAGLTGCLSVMRSIGMIKGGSSFRKSKKKTLIVAKSSLWVRAPISGAFSVKKKIGDSINKEDVLATISDPFGRETVNVVSEEEGILIGAALLPLVNQGDAMFHIATFRDIGKIRNALDNWDL